MTLGTILVYIFVAICAISATAIPFLKNLVHAAFSFLLCLLSLAALYVLAGSELLAVIQIMVYIGGILVLLLFGIMLTKTSESESSIHFTKSHGIIAISIFCFMARIAWILYTNPIEDRPWKNMISKSNPNQELFEIGKALMSTQSLAFELIGFLLTIALIAAAIIASNKHEST